jgi:putative DNA primase/helicase
MANAKDYPPPTLEEAMRALYCIPADCEEKEWSDTGMSLASEFPTTGFPVFNDWSATAPEKYDAADLKSRWKGWTRKRGKTIATLFYIAKRYGYRRDPNAAPPSSEELAKREREKTDRERQREETERREREETAHAEQRAADLWAVAQPAPDSHGYLLRKGIQAHGLRLFRGILKVAGMALDGCLMVPALDMGGTIRSLQFIHPDIPGKDGKRNLPKAEIKGRFWRLGEFSESGPVYIAEGPATAASIFEASEACTLCAFSAGNLEAVALQVRQGYPEARIILCPDNDPTGIKNATQAVRAVAGLIALPSFTASGEPA